MYSKSGYFILCFNFNPEAVSHQLEKMPRGIEEIQRDIDAAIEACECFEGGSPRETRNEIRRQMTRLQALSFEVRFVIL